MAHSGSFKVPSAVAQDLAIIMEFIDPPQSHANVRLLEKVKFKLEGTETTGAKSEIESDEDIASSGTESEDEVEAQIALGLGSDGDGRVKTSA
jgi:predicted metalloprotease